MHDKIGSLRETLRVNNIVVKDVAQEHKKGIHIDTPTSFKSNNLRYWKFEDGFFVACKNETAKYVCATLGCNCHLRKEYKSW